MPRWLPLVALLAPLAGLTVAVTPPAPPRAEPAGPVRLGVLLVFDQLRGDYLDRWRPHFGDRGFRRLQADGAWFTKCYYPYATTTTGPGHAAALTGTSGATHGIINNDWYDRAAGAAVYCAGSDRYTLVPPPVTPPKKKEVGNPDRLLAPTVADGLKAATGGTGKVFGLSLKDRSAILPTGKRPDGAYWFDGRFVTSTYYRDAVHPWVAEFNRSGLADSYFGKDWVRARPDLDYDKIVGPDDGPGEGAGDAQGKTFPHPTTGGLTTPGPKYYDAVANSPWGNDLLLALAKACVVAERLGQDDTPDLLVVSFSSNDLIGHTWGPDSHEVLDVTLRSDGTVAELLAFLDETVGAGKYAVAVTADHGVAANPEVSKGLGLDAGRARPADIEAAVERFLTGKYGAAGGTQKWVEEFSVPGFYLNRRLLSARGLAADAVAADLAGFLPTLPVFVGAYTAAQLGGPPPANDPMFPLVKKSFHPDRSGDVVVVTRPYWLIDKYGTGTSHGAPHEYDRHVPLLAFGPGVAPGAKAEPAVPQQAAPFLAKMLGVPPPAKCEYPLPRTLMKK